MSETPLFSGIDHIDLVVKDPDEMAAFFMALGYRFHRRTDHGGGSIELHFPGEGEQPILELTSQQDGTGKVRPLGLRHIALRADDLQAAITHFSAKSLSVKSGPRTIPDTGRTVVNLIDPEGGTLQIVDGGCTVALDTDDADISAKSVGGVNF
ncbi:VOC family protein [uncultured Paracoccus sp.]|uniref:VOC family protein n=1 Tax=uncultured Paracoccus sp. TaxID=189685 RepID=UPI0025D3B3D7|nr:VOC family protein [uncultured Paracoccus sp.]